MVVFKDRYATVGRVKPVVHLDEKTAIPARSTSRSLDSLIKNKELKNLQIEIRDNGYLVIDTSHIVGDRVKISRTNAIKFAKWVISVYGKRGHNK